MSEIPVPPEPIGKVITLVQDFLAIDGQVPEFDLRDAVVRGTDPEKGDEPPLVIVSRNAISDFPFGAGSGRMGLADYTYTVRCYGEKEIWGERQAAKLAGLVRAALHNHLPVVMGTVGIHRIRVLSTGSPLRDPEMDWPFVPLSVGLYASAVAAAS